MSRTTSWSITEPETSLRRRSTGTRSRLRSSHSLLSFRTQVRDTRETSAHASTRVRADFAALRAVWEYVHPQIPQLIEEEKKRAHEHSIAQARSDARRKRNEKIDAKKKFFRTRLAKIRESYTDAIVQDYLPSLADFCRLPIVRDFWDDPEFAVTPSRKKEDIDKWRERFEEILEVVGEYKIDVRLAALKTILAATTDQSEAEIDTLDVDVLADPTYGDEFFLRPSSWVLCSVCSHFGPLAEVLRHRRVEHAEDDLAAPAGLKIQTIAQGEERAADRKKKEENVPSVGTRRKAIIEASSADEDDDEDGEVGKEATSDTAPGFAVKEETKPVVELSLEVACAMISVCEIGRIDADDPTLTAKDFDEKFEETRFVWKNGKDGRTARRTWVELVSRSVLLPPCLLSRRSSIHPPQELTRASLLYTPVDPVRLLGCSPCRQGEHGPARPRDR